MTAISIKSIEDSMHYLPTSLFSTKIIDAQDICTAAKAFEVERVWYGYVNIS